MKKKTSAPTQKKDSRPVVTTKFIIDRLIKKIERREKLTGAEKMLLKEPPTFNLQVGEAWFTPFKILKSDEPRFKTLLLPCTKAEQVIEKKREFLYSITDDGKKRVFPENLYCIRDYKKYMYWGVGKKTIKVEKKAFWRWIALLRKEYKAKGMVLRGNQYPMMTGRYVQEPETVWNVNHLKQQLIKKAA